MKQSEITQRPPHLLLGLLEALRVEVDVLERRDETLLQTRRQRLERLLQGDVRQRVLQQMTLNNARCNI